MMLSLSQSAKRVGVSKATIHRAIKSGKLSAVRNDDGSYQIDLAELARVYPSKLDALNGSDSETPEPVSEPVSERSNETLRNPKRNEHNTASSAVAEAELDGARLLIKTLQDQLEDIRSDRDGWRQQAEAALRQAESAQRLLTDDREAAAPRPWWKRLAS